MGITAARDEALTTSTDFAQGNDGGQGGNGNENSGEHGNHDSRPVPSFWNFAENDRDHNNVHHPFKLMRHHA